MSNRSRFHYYGCSMLLLAALSACAGPNQVARTATRLSIQELDTGDRAAVLSRLSRLPVVLHFQKGDRIPVHFTLDSEFAALEVQPWTLVAKRDFYLLLRADGMPLLSRDGVDFEAPRKNKNSFLFGFALEGQRPAELRIGLGIWPEAKAK